MSGWRLVSDVGGTNIRFARAGTIREISDLRRYPVSQFSSFNAAASHYLDNIGRPAGCNGIIIGAAGAVFEGTVSLTNLAWHISEKEIESFLGVPCKIINDVQAVAYSLPHLTGSDTILLGPHAPSFEKAERLLVANMGTGFGAAMLLRGGTAWFTVPSEAGHVSLPHRDAWDKRPEVLLKSVEHVLSGQGLSKLHAAVSRSGCELAPATLISQARRDPDCAATLRLFAEIAGDVLGNLALSMAAWHGVYLCGSVAKAFAAEGDLPRLRKSFCNKGPMAGRMEKIPIVLITREEAALMGLAVLPMPN